MSLTFLEYAVAAGDVLDSLGFYRGLGFTELKTSDAAEYPYAVVSDGRIHLGLHGIEDFANSLRFVKRDVRRSVLGLSDQAIEFEDVHLGEDELHQASLRGPNGHRITWIEARTFSPSIDEGADSALGEFLELTLPVRELYEAARFWAPFAASVVGESEEPPRMRFEANGLLLGLCETRPAAPTLSFLVRDAEALQARMDRLGIIPAAGSPPPGAFSMLVAPEGTRLALYREDFI